MFNGSCTNSEYFSSKMGHIFLLSLKTPPNSFNYHIKFEPFLPIKHVCQNLQFLMMGKLKKSLFSKIEFSHLAKKYDLHAFLNQILNTIH